MKKFILTLKNYSDFKGRTNRTDFINFFLNYLLFLLLSIILNNLIIGAHLLDFNLGFLFYSYVFITFLPTLALIVRRLHDVNKCSYYLFIFFLPVIGLFYLTILLLKDGFKEKNKYGPASL